MPKSLKDDLEVVSNLDLKQTSANLGFKCELSTEFLRFAIANVLLFDRKHQDYGLNNIKFGTFGCIVKASDKFARIEHLFQANRKKPANEKLEDSFRDISNYMNIILMVEKDKWH